MLTCKQVHAELPLPPIDDRCEFRKAVSAFNRQLTRTCDAEADSCTENRIMQLDEPEDHAQEYCWRRALPLDTRFVGACPDTLAKLEASVGSDRESLMQLIYLRNEFSIRNDVDYPIDVYKREESLQIIRNVLSIDPNNPVALTLLRWTLSFVDDEVEYLKLKLKIHELDSDCPEWLGLFPYSTYGSTNVIVDNWLAGEGSGSELTDEEMADLLQRVQRNLISAYDQLIEQAEGKQKLHWALDSVHNAILARGFENFQQLADRVDIGLVDHVENRRASLVEELSREYDVDSAHGRTTSLIIACSNHAFELGLLEHCLKILDHFSIEDSKFLESPAADWTRAAISVVNALTRDCSEEHPLEFLFVPTWWSDRQCYAELHLAVTSDVLELVERFLEFGANAEQEVLAAYFRLDETSDERFIRALAMDSSMIIYAAPLSQRLHRLGLTEGATNIIESIDHDRIKQLTSEEESLLNHVSDSITDGTYKNWDESGVDFQGTASP